MFKLLVTGDRNWTDGAAVEYVLDLVIEAHGAKNVLLIAGRAKGLDTIAATVAKDKGVHVAEVEALWETYHRAAGPIRNGVMLALAPDEVIAFHNDIENSKGTKHCYEAAIKRGIPARLVTTG